jgi:hypothetical protein
MLPFLVIALHSERDGPEVNERRDDKDVGDAKDDPPRFASEITGEMVEEEALGEDGKVQCWKVMMNVQHTKSLDFEGNGGMYRPMMKKGV